MQRCEKRGQLTFRALALHHAENVSHPCFPQAKRPVQAWLHHGIERTQTKLLLHSSTTPSISTATSVSQRSDHKRACSARLTLRLDFRYVERSAGGPGLPTDIQDLLAEHARHFGQRRGLHVERWAGLELARAGRPVPVASGQVPGEVRLGVEHLRGGGERQNINKATEPVWIQQTEAANVCRRLCLS